MSSPLGTPLRILIADPDATAAATHEEALRGPGYQFARALSGRQLVELCRAAPPDLVLTELHLPDGPALPAVAEATRERRVPVVVFAAELSADDLIVAGDLSLAAALVKPVEPAALRAAVDLALRAFARAEALRAEVADLRQQLADRKVIERAKGAVVRRLGVDEQEAFRRMRKLSSDRNAKLIEVAGRVLDAEQVFADLEGAGGPAPRDGRRRPGHNGNGAAGHGRGAWPAGSVERVAERANEAMG